MENLGGLDVMEEMEEKEEKVVDFPEKKRQPFCYWEVGGKIYQMKLKAAQVGKLENKYRRNLTDVVMEGGMPPLSVMLTFIQAGMEPWHHGVTYTDVQKMYDRWEEDGGSQQELFGKVIMPLMAVSGFFTEKTAAEIMEKIQEEL